MSLFETATKKYAEQALSGAKGRILLAAAAGFLLLDAAARGPYESAWLSLFHTPLSDYLDLPSLAKRVTLQIPLLALAGAIIGVTSHRWCAKKLVSVGIRDVSTTNRIAAIYANCVRSARTESLDKAILRAAEYSRRGSKRLSVTFQIGALCAAIGCISLLSFFYGGNSLDFLLGLLMCAASAVLAAKYGPLFVTYGLPSCVLTDANLGLLSPDLVEASLRQTEQQETLETSRKD
jgi:hypothetical protein